MVWSPANITRPEHSPVLSFLSFLVHYLGYSYDEKFTKSEQSETQLKDEYDFIVVGAGSAGCVLANRLSEVENWTVLLLEAGDEEPIVADVPGLWPVLRGSSVEYDYVTQPEPFICSQYKDNSCPAPRGKVMGGTSSINDMIYSRGNQQDFDDWSELGNEGWSYENVLPYFKKSEDARDPVTSTNKKSHATGGYLKVEKFPYEDRNSQIIINAWKELGLEEVDYNSGSQIGTSRMQFTSIHGSRLSSNGAFIRPIRGRRSNLSIRTNAKVIRVIIEESSMKATGVEYFDLKSNETKRVKAKKEVILSAGAFESPKLLMLSGIGVSDNLQEANIKVIKDLPVGRNLHDHTVVIPFGFDFKNDSSITVADSESYQNDLVYWMNFHEGPLSATGMQSTITYYQTPHEQRPGVPDIQVGIAGSVSGRINGSSAYQPIATSYYDSAVVFLVLLKPYSRGYLKLNKSNPVWSHPLIYLNSMTDKRDINVFTEGIRIADEIKNTNSFKNNNYSYVRLPGCNKLDNDSEYYDCVLQKYSFTSNHVVGTCKMGPKDDDTAVVDPRLRVRGISGLRVVDGSVMPETVRASTNAAIIMMGEKGSDLIKEDWLKRPSPPTDASTISAFFKRKR